MENQKSIFLSLLGLVFLISCGTEPTPTYQLTTSVVGNGSVNPSSGQFDEGESVTITSNPDSGWVFSNWEGDWTSSQTPATITMDSDKTIIGVFERKEYPLNITIGEGEGSVSERVVSQPKVTDYPFETVVELTPVPANEWWVFSSWSGDITSDQQVVEVTVNGKTNVTVNFGFTGTSRKTTNKYDSNNNLLEQVSYYSDGTESERRTYVFDTNNNRIEYEYYQDGVFMFEFKWEYDSNNNMTKESLIESDGSVSRWEEFIYDSNKNKIEEIRYSQGGSIQKLIYEYDIENNLLKESTYDIVDGVPYLTILTEYEYDSKNNMIYRALYNSDNDLFQEYVFTYNSNNDITEMVWWIKNTNSYRYTYEYDSNANLITYTRYKDGSVANMLKYEYDDNNNIILFISYNSSGVQNYKYTHEYDSLNRRIKSIKFDVSNNPESFTTFEYDSNNNLIEQISYLYIKGKIVTIQKETDPLNELCNQLDLPEQQVIPMLCGDIEF